MKKPDQYIIGFQPVPDWCIDKLMPYQKMNGSIGYLFYGDKRSFELNKGDRLIRRNDKIKIKRKGMEQWTKKSS